MEESIRSFSEFSPLPLCADDPEWDNDDLEGPDGMTALRVKGSFFFSSFKSIFSQWRMLSYFVFKLEANLRTFWRLGLYADPAKLDHQRFARKKSN